jgi:hypothetical protein
VSAAQVALAWLAGRPGIANIIVGARTEAQLKDNLAAASLVLTAEERKLLDDVSLLPLLYPYWHQCNTVATNGWARMDLALHAPHVAKRQAAHVEQKIGDKIRISSRRYTSCKTALQAIRQAATRLTRHSTETDVYFE